MMPAAADSQIMVVGAGIMGTGIAQVAAQAGHTVMLFDSKTGAAEKAKENLSALFEKLIGKSKVTREEANDILARVHPTSSMDSAEHSILVIEAIVEKLEPKRQLFEALESIVSSDCILATNTSSLSVTGLAKTLKHQGRFVGMHFFNPVALMKLTEVVSGLQTTQSTVDFISDLAKRWGKHPVQARSTPGFIVNRIARPFYAESLSLLQEQAATADDIDTCMRSAGFKMGPCELMDLIGHDTNFAVTMSVYSTSFYDKRYMPSLLQKEMVEGGLLGQKSGQGFYTYPKDKKPAAVKDAKQIRLPSNGNISLMGDCEFSRSMLSTLKRTSISFKHIENSPWNGLQIGNHQLRLTNGETATALGNNVAVFDLSVPFNSDQNETYVSWSHSHSADKNWIKEAPQWLTFFGLTPIKVKDVPGLLVARTIAMIINEAADAVNQGVCNQADANTAMKSGVNYPAGPFEWLETLNIHWVVNLLDNLDHFYRGERYRVSPMLRQLASQDS